MKQTLLFLLLIITVLAHSQSVQRDTPVVENKIFKVVEQMPEYPGGDESMMKFIQSNMVYPKYARKHNIQGRVVIGFIVSEDGTLTDISVKRSVDPQIDAEAMRVISLMPKFKPGKEKGKPVRVQFVLPIMFKLS